MTSFNINKAFHIDDTFHLEAAYNIIETPLEPMTGLVNWGDSPTAMYEHNQPPLFFYLIASVIYVFGESEIVMHLLLSIFSFLALYFFACILYVIQCKDSRCKLLIFAFSPALLINQNLMVDIPALSLILGSCYYLFIANEHKKFSCYLAAILFFSIALLIKYSVLPFIIPIAVALFNSRKNSYWALIFIPLLLLVLWSCWNYIEFGSFHIWGREISNFTFDKIPVFLSSVGSVSVFAFLYLKIVFSKRSLNLLLTVIMLCFLIFAFFVYVEIISESFASVILNYIFILIGLLVALFIVYSFCRDVSVQSKEYFESHRFLLLLIVCGVSSFVVFFAPFIATRHLLLIIPFLLLYSDNLCTPTFKVSNNIIIVASISLGMLLCVSDWLYADFYRERAKEVIVTNNTTWSLGHWGWQWYSKGAGMKVYSFADSDKVKEGDFFVYPLDVSRQKLHKSIKLKRVKYITQESNLLTFFSGNNFASMYNSTFVNPSWTLSKKTIDTIAVFRVDKILRPQINN